MKHFRKTVNKQLGEILVERGVISRSKLEEVLVYQKEKGLLFGEALVQMKLATEEDVVQALTCQYGFPYLPLANYEIAPEVVATVPLSLCKQYCLVPIDKIGRSLTLAMVNPLNVQALEDVEKATTCSVQAFVSTATEINSAINRYYGNALMLPTQETLKEILLRDQLITPEDLNRAVMEQERTGGELSRVLLRLKLVPEDQLSIVLSEALQLPLINLNLFRIDPAILKLVPREIAEKSMIIPISKLNDQLTIAMVDPLDILTIDNIKAMTSMSVSVVLARPKEMRAALDRSYGSNNASDLEEIFQDIKETREAEQLELVKEQAPANKRHIEDISEEAPIITLTNTIIQQAVAAKASDVFIEPMENCLRIRYRVDGFLREIDRMPKNLHFPLISRIKVISSLDIAEHRLPQDGRFRIVTNKNNEVDFRVNVLPTALGEKIVLRVLDKDQEMASIDKLGFEADSLARLKECCQKPHGMILACGPTGSGKTTTLYAILKHIDSPGRNIVTVEDPVEFQMKGFNQVNIRSEVGLTFPAALRSILRQDPDVILIGEIRDSETMDIAVKAALTGHLVVSSLHTTTGPGSITRMINMGIEPFLITSSVIAIVAQRLVRRVCMKCREPYKVSEEVMKEFHLRELIPSEKWDFYKSKGCDKCLKSGYKGRVGITETMVLTNKIKELILLSSSEAEIKAAARSQGMTTMRQDAVLKAAQGLTTLEEVIRLTAPD